MCVHETRASPTYPPTCPCPLPLRMAGIPELVRRLQQRGQAVFLVSGGFREVINPIAGLLHIPLDHVFANTILYKVRQAPGRGAGGMGESGRISRAHCGGCAHACVWPVLRTRACADGHSHAGQRACGWPG